MTGDQENAESGKALFDLISDLSAGYRTNAVLTAGLHLAASALVLGSDSLEQAEQQAEMSGERFIVAVRTIWALKYQDDTDLNRPSSRLRLFAVIRKQGDCGV
jgi:hypothetical protein